ncbi:MAG TPA: hypothetical protein VGD84_11470 [Pseudonocardiaceae bacterium]
MHTWVRRGLQTALVTGGLLMLGTGIASADENVNPDTPPSPVDAQVSVPIDTSQNALGTPAGQMQAPSIQRNVSTGEVTGALPMSKVAPVVAQANPLIRQSQPSLQAVGGGDLLRGNKVVANATVPIQICGNAVAVGGDAAETGMCSQVVAQPDPISTSGSGNALAGNVVAANAVVPVQATGNAIAAIGNAVAQSMAGQSGTVGGDITTGGTGGTVSGTIGVIQWATPVQVANNAVAGGGSAAANSASESDGFSNGSLRTCGDNGTGAGTLGAAPVALPVQVDGNGLSGAGNASSQSQSTANSTAGTTSANNIGLWGHPSWGRTSGDPSTASGNVAQPQVSGPVSVDDNAGGLVGNQSATSTNNSTNSAGGLSSTTGTGSTGSGNFVDAPVALPTSGGGNGVVGVGNATSNHTTNTSSTAGGATLTNGNNSTLSGNSANVPPAGAADVCGAAVGGAGGSTGVCNNNVTSTAGGYNGTTGNNSTVSGNIGQTPTTVPVEGYGIAGGGAGNASSTANEVKTITSGGTQTTGSTTSTAGGDASSTGSGGSVSGNVVQVSNDVVDQAFGNAASGVGIVGTNTGSTTNSTAGGNTSTTGDYSSLSGNAVAVPDTVANRVFGDAVAAGSKAWANGSDNSNLASGGTLTSTGIDGSGAGNVVTVPVALDPDAFGNAVSGVGNATGVADSQSVVNNGGDSFTDGFGPLAAYDFNFPLGTDLGLRSIEAPVLGSATTVVEDNSVTNNGFVTQSASTMDLPLVGGLLGSSTSTPATPSLPGIGLLDQLPLLSMLTNLGGAAMHTQDLPATGVGNLPTVPQVPLAQGAVGQVAQLPVQHVVSTPASMLQGAQAMGHGAPGISGVLPLQQGLLPKI